MNANTVRLNYEYKIDFFIDDVWKPLSTFTCDRIRQLEVGSFCNKQTDCQDGSDELCDKKTGEHKEFSYSFL